MGDDVKAKILARRARFVAAALATVSVQACSPQVCLEPTPAPDAGSDTQDASDADTRPQACLTPEPPDTSVDADAATDAAEGG